MLVRCMATVFLALMLIATALVGPGAPLVSADEAVYHTISWGETLSSIARKYLVTVESIVDVNHLSSANVIYAGQVLRIPPVASSTAVYMVRPGDSLLKISHDYGVSIWEIAERNSIRNVNLVFVGQVLVIPTGEEPVPEVTKPSLPSPPVVQEAIVIKGPGEGEKVSSPVTVTGWGGAYGNTLAVDILDESGVRLGQGFVIVDADAGEFAPFEGTIDYTAPAQAQAGRIQVYSISPRDGAIEHLASVTVELRP